MHACSVAQSCLTVCDPMDYSMLGFPVHHQLPELTQNLSIQLVMPSNHLILCRPPSLLPSIFPSIRIFSNESDLLTRWPKYWSQGHPSAPALSTLSHALNLDWRSVSHMMIYMFQCYSLESSHPRLLPVSVFSLSSPVLSIFGKSPKDCSLHLSLFCCLAYRVLVTIFLNSFIYALVYCMGVFLFGLLHSV